MLIFSDNTLAEVGSRNRVFSPQGAVDGRQSRHMSRWGRVTGHGDPAGFACHICSTASRGAARALH